MYNLTFANFQIRAPTHLIHVPRIFAYVSMHLAMCASYDEFILFVCVCLCVNERWGTESILTWTCERDVGTNVTNLMTTNRDIHNNIMP